MKVGLEFDPIVATRLVVKRVNRWGLGVCALTYVCHGAQPVGQQKVLFDGARGSSLGSRVE